LDDIFPTEQLKMSKHLSVYQLESLYLENKGGSFQVHPLPINAQFSAVQGIVVEEFTGDNIMDILLAGNFYPFRVQQGPSDAGKGLLLEGVGNGVFNCRENNKLGVFIDGDVRDAKILEHDNKTDIIFSKNNDSIQVVRFLE
jgi:hypothetical protein